MSTVHTRERQYNGSRNIDKNSTTAHGGFALKVRNVLGPGQYGERFYERAVKKKVFSMPPTVLGS
jgi:hypothetical protein